jgi:hypothetical protein
LLPLEAEGYELTAERVRDIPGEFGFAIVEHHLRRRLGDAV